MDRTWLWLIGPALLLFAATSAPAATPEMAFKIESQPVDSALTAFANQSGLQLLFHVESAAIEHGVRSPGVEGTLTPEAALERLLANTGLRFEFINARTVTIRAAEDARPRPTAQIAEDAQLRLAQADPAQGSPAAPEPQRSRGTTATARNRASDDTLEEIIVTAQKRSERLQDVPGSVAVVTAEDIRAKNVTRMEDLQYSVPGLSINDFGPGQRNIQIRGISGILGRPTTGEYLNDLSISGDSSNGGVRLTLLDMERVEVLRGPQGTLYGEGSMGGAIRYITASPELTRLSASAEAEGGHVSGGGESYRANGVLNIPLIEDRLGVRLVAGYEKNAGWIDNAFSGDSDVNDVSIKTFRGELLSRPTDGLQLSILALHQNSDQDQGDFAVGGTSTASVETYDRDRYSLVSGTLRLDLGAVNLTDTIGYIDHRTRAQFDFTPLFLPLLTDVLGVPPGFITQIFNPEPMRNRTFSNELRFSSDQTESRLDWLTGVFFRSSRLEQDSFITTSPGSLPFEILNLDSTQKSDSIAVFGEVSYQLTQRLNALVGLRYYHDREHFDATSVSFGDAAVTGEAASFHALNPRFNLRYTFSPKSMVYVNAAEGFRSGGFNPATTSATGVQTPPTFDPDKVRSYEIGTKQQLFDRRLELEGAVYYNDWTDVQSTFTPPGAAAAYTANAGKVTGWGVDFSAITHPVDGLTLSVSYGRNDLEFRTNTDSKRAGDPVDYSPRNSFAASLDYRRPVFEGREGFFRADYQHNGRAQVTLRDFGQIVPLPARNTVNLHAGLIFGRFETSLFARNVFDSDTPIQIGPYGAIQENVEQRPRNVGINVSAHF